MTGKTVAKTKDKKVKKEKLPEQKKKRKALFIKEKPMIQRERKLYSR